MSHNMQTRSKTKSYRERAQNFTMTYRTKHCTRVSSLDASKEKCRLLDLSAEMRNLIYDYSLLTLADEDGELEAAADWKLPGSLGTCKQVRQEALPMYYLRNQFAFTIHDCDGRVYVKRLAKFAPYMSRSRHGVKGMKKRQIFERHVGQPKWSNLLAWLKLEYDAGFQYGEERMLPGSDTDLVVIDSAQKMVGAAVSEGREWSCVQVDLECFHQAVKALDPNWA